MKFWMSHDIVCEEKHKEFLTKLQSKTKLVLFRHTNFVHLSKNFRKFRPIFFTMVSFVNFLSC